LNKPIIVGLDAGLTVGIAILDFHGNILKLASIRGATKSEIVKYITKIGKPIIIASDVNPLPKMIEKMASSLGSKVFYPEVSLSNVEKIKIIEDYAEKIENSHEKDALAAALKAYRAHHYIVLKIEETLERMDRKDMFSKVLEKMVKTGKENIVDTIRKMVK
jgi:predicted RNase H-like nuclease (RuvC/YqgF family)